MSRHDGEFYADPMNVAERFIRLVALHDNVNDPSKVTLKSSFESLNLNSLDLAEILLQAEREFDLEISDDDCESFHSVNDVVEFLSRNFYTKWKQNKINQKNKQLFSYLLYLNKTLLFFRSPFSEY